MYNKYNENIYNIYNNIYNLYNVLENIQESEYYLYLYFKKLEDEISDIDSESSLDDIDEDIKLTNDEDDIVFDDTSDDDDDDDTSDSDDDSNNIDIYDSNFSYKKKHYNTNKQLTNKVFSKDYNELCKLEKRPSILSKGHLEIFTRT